jgi:hypothetical protein
VTETEEDHSFIKLDQNGVKPNSRRRHSQLRHSLTGYVIIGIIDCKLGLFAESSQDVLAIAGKIGEPDLLCRAKSTYIASLLVSSVVTFTWTRPGIALFLCDSLPLTEPMAMRSPPPCNRLLAWLRVFSLKRVSMRLQC